MAFDTFCQFWLPCTYQRDGANCHNFKSSHGPKGHQGPNGNMIGVGPFQTTFDQNGFIERWTKGIMDELGPLNEQFLAHLTATAHAHQFPRSIAAARIHRQRMVDFLISRVREPSDFVSHRVCLFCLRHNMPENALPCGHTVCNRCLDMFSARNCDRDTVRRIPFCPYHSKNQELVGGQCFEVPVKPSQAGIRILCLDGCVILIQELHFND